MTKQTKKVLSLSLLALALALPTVVFAQNEVQQGLMGIGTIFPRGGIAGSTTLTGPFGLIANIIRYMLLIAGAIAVMFIIIGGFQYVTSAGNAEAAEKGKNTLVNAIIGIVIIVLSYVIINVVINFVSGPGGLF